MCSNDIKKEVLSPDKKHKLVKFQRNCGATTDFTMQVSILETGNKLVNDPGNVLSMENDSVEISWIANNQILIRYAGTDQFIRDTAYKGINIYYQHFLLPANAFDRNLVPSIQHVSKVEIIRGEWKEPGASYNFQNHAPIVINSADSLKQVYAVIRSAKHLKNLEPPGSWMQVRIFEINRTAQLMLVKTPAGYTYFSYENEWFDGESLCRLLLPHVRK